MPHPKGLSKTGGRSPGTPNNETDAIAQKLAILGCDPIEGLAQIAMNSETMPELKVPCLADLGQYIYPKRKAADVLPESEGITTQVEFVGEPKNDFLNDSRPSLSRNISARADDLGNSKLLDS